MKNFLKSIIFCLILLCLLEGIVYFLLPRENIKKYGIFKVSTYEILNEKLDSLDTVFMGDSLIYSSISPLEIWHEYGITSYAYASPAQLIHDTYDNMKVVIDSQHPKIILLEANVLYRNPKNAPKYSKYNLSKRYNQAFAVVNYHNNWKKHLFKLVDHKTNYSATNDFKGFKYIPEVQAADNYDYMKYTSEISSLPENNLEYFQKIIKLCNENNVKLVLISTPNKLSWNYSKYLGIVQLASEYQLEYLDLNVNNPLNINWQTETKDKGSHVNYVGAKKVTAYFGKYLKETNLLPDHRNEEEYSNWDSAYKRYENTINS